MLEPNQNHIRVWLLSSKTFKFINLDEIQPFRNYWTVQFSVDPESSLHILIVLSQRSPVNINEYLARASCHHLMAQEEINRLQKLFSKNE